MELENSFYQRFNWIKEFRCYGAKIEKSEKAGSRRESYPGHLWLEPPVLCQPPTLTILYGGGSSQVSCLFTFFYFRLITSKFPAWGKMLWAYKVASLLKRRFFVTQLKLEKHFADISTELFQLLIMYSSWTISKTVYWTFLPIFADRTLCDLYIMQLSSFNFVCYWQWFATVFWCVLSWNMNITCPHINGARCRWFPNVN